ncbi:MAG: CHRD domain-containing protein [Armatimonadetes bacterium]|nr:CHRD domain-containing protein [Armatimonadota bacterium]
MRQWIKGVIAGSLLVGVLPASAQKRWYVDLKLEDQEAYATLVWHGLVDRTESHTPVWPQNFWQTDLRADEADNPKGDKVTIASFGRHIFAPHLAEPPIGKLLSFGAYFATAKPGLEAFHASRADPHGDLHLDYQFAGAADEVKGRNIVEYVFVGGGIHISDGNWQRILERLGKAAADQAVPPTTSDARAMSVIVSAENGQALLLIAVRGISTETLFSADIRLGARGDAGVPVLDLGPPSAWVATEIGMVRTITWRDFPPGLRGSLEQGLLAVNIATWANPSGDIRGQLEVWPSTLRHIGPHR